MRTSDYYVSTDKSLLNTEVIWGFLKDQIWSKNIPKDYIKRFINYSLCFGVYDKTTQKQIGFARVISDYTTYAYVCDLVIDSSCRRKGLAKKLFAAIMGHPELQGLKTWSLRTTKDARKMYEALGFKAAEYPDSILELENLSIYSQPDFINLYKKDEVDAK